MFCHWKKLTDTYAVQNSNLHFTPNLFCIALILYANEKFIDKGTETDTFNNLEIQTEEVDELHNDDTSEVDKVNDDDCDDIVTVNSSPTARDSGFSEKHFPSSPDNSLLSSVHSQKVSSSSSGQTLYRNRHHACFPEHYYDR